MTSSALAAALVVAASVAPQVAREYDGPLEVVARAETTEHAAAIERTPTLERRAAPPERTRVRRLGPVRVRWALDAAITAGAGVPYAVLALAVAPRASTPPLPLEDPKLGPVDRAAFGGYDVAAKHASDALLIGAIAMGPIATAGLVGAQVRGQPRAARRFFAAWGGLVLIHAEALALTGLVTEVIKSATRRPRPFAYYEPSDVDASERDELREDQSGPDHSRSFPSGHASLAFAAVTCTATTLTLALVGDRRKRGAIAAAWTIGLAIATTTATLRVVAGRHHPSDIVAGAALGAGIGIAVPLAHAALPRTRGLAIVPQAGRAGAGLAIRGRLP